MTDLILENICKKYGEKTVLQDVSFVFPGGRRTCIMGPSGCGKTTLLRIILGLETSDAGTMTGRPERLSAVFQENRLFEDFSALSNVAAVCSKEDKGKIEEHLTALGLGDSRTKPVRT